MLFGKVRRSELAVFVGLLMVANRPRTIYKFTVPLCRGAGFPWLAVSWDPVGTETNAVFHWPALGLDVIVWAAFLLVCVAISKRWR